MTPYAFDDTLYYINKMRSFDLEQILKMSLPYKECELVAIPYPDPMTSFGTFFSKSNLSIREKILLLKYACSYSEFENSEPVMEFLENLLNGCCNLSPAEIANNLNNMLVLYRLDPILYPDRHDGYTMPGKYLFPRN